MKFRRTKLSPSYTRKPIFKSHESKERRFEFACANCDAPMSVEYDQLIGQAFDWEQNVGEDLAAEAKEFYDIGVVGKSPDGGWPSMIKVPCPKCEITHLVYAGIDEVRNSVHYVTLQGIAEIIEEDKSSEG